MLLWLLCRQSWFICHHRLRRYSCLKASKIHGGGLRNTPIDPKVSLCIASESCRALHKLNIHAWCRIEGAHWRIWLKVGCKAIRIREYLLSLWNWVLALLRILSWNSVWTKWPRPLLRVLNFHRHYRWRNTMWRLDKRFLKYYPLHVLIAVPLLCNGPSFVCWSAAKYWLCSWGFLSLGPNQLSITVTRHRLLWVDSVFNKLSKFLDWDMSNLSSLDGLIGDKPRQNILIGI